MYNFVFYVIYNYQKSRNKSNGFARYNAALVTSLIIVLQLLILITVIKKLIYPEIVFLLKNKFIIGLTFIGFGIAAYKYFDWTKIESKASNSVYSPTNFRKLIVFLIVAFSFTLIAILSKKQA